MLSYTASREYENGTSDSFRMLIVVVVIASVAIVLKLSLNLFVLAPNRTIHDNAPVTCTHWSEEELVELSDSFLKDYTSHSNQPRAIILLGGPASGKGTYHRRFIYSELPEYVLHGLDEYLPLSPEYKQLFQDPLKIYKSAADSCYPAIIPLAKKIFETILKRRLDVVYEETGKDRSRLERLIKRFQDNGYIIEVVVIRTEIEEAVFRANRRFLESGRYASEEYIRASQPFEGVKEWIHGMAIPLTSCTNHCSSVDQECLHCKLVV